METVSGDLYDFPVYYDLVFGSDWKAEYEFLLNCFGRFAERDINSVFEPACGTGRLLYRLAKRGYSVSGLDLNPKAVEYCNDRLERHGFERSAFVGDMTDFRLKRPADAAFNMINSFRHLQTERLARDHLKCVAEALRPGGLYLLGLHLSPTEVEPMEEESWSARRGNLYVNTRLWTTNRDLEQREESFQMTYDVYTLTRSFRIEDTIVFRTYTAPQFLDLLKSVNTLSLVETFDFAYDIKRPISIDGTTEDVVFVLRKQ